MYEVIKAAIEAGHYQLEEMLLRIRTFAAKGLISGEEMSALEEMARQSAEARSEVDVFHKLTELEQRIRKLEMGESPQTDPEYVTGKWYYRGDRVMENGVSYICCAPENVVCTWSPTDYPAYWTKAE